jgi:hypothetical protein
LDDEGREGKEEEEETTKRKWNCVEDEDDKNERSGCPALLCLTGLCVIVIQANESKKKGGRRRTLSFSCINKAQCTHTVSFSFCQICRFFFICFFVQLHRMVRG